MNPAPGAADPSASGGTSKETPAGVRQGFTASDEARQAVQGSGVQYVYFGEGRPAAVSVSAEPPWGQRDETRPVRGRERLLADLAGGTGSVWVVCGLGGCGKTRLALEAAFAARQAGVLVWWVSAAEEGVLEAGMQAVGRRLGVPEADLEHSDAADVIWAHLAGWPQRWLLVLDNADDPPVLAGAATALADGRGWLRPVTNSAGMVLVTSRDGRPEAWGSWCRRVRLGMLPGEQAAAVLADHAGHQAELGSEQDARELAMRLGCLPLALRIAGLYLAESAAIPAAFADETRMLTGPSSAGPGMTVG